MATIGLVDVDGHNFPNLALMRISQYYKSVEKGNVDWWIGNLVHYDVVYASKIFSEEYTKDIDIWNADEIHKGGSGYQIHLIDGKEVYDTETDEQLPPEIEHMRPDYSLYPQYKFAVAMTSRGCPRGCPWCHVGAKEGRASRKVADVDQFYDGQKRIMVLDPNITACRDKTELFKQYIDTGAIIEFSQGLDIRLLTDDDVELLHRMKRVNIHYAWDNPEEDLKDRFVAMADGKNYNSHGHNGTVYVLTNFNSTIEQDIYRVMTLRELGYKPYVNIYDKPHSDRNHREFARWVNNPKIFYSTTYVEYQLYDRKGRLRR